MRTTDRRFAALMILPAALFLLIFIGWPLIQFVSNSFFDINQLAGTRRFVGFGNYLTAFTDPDFGNSAWRTAVYTAIVVFFEFAIGLLVALLFATIGDRSRVFRTIFLYPLMIAPIVAGLLWKFLLSDNFGIVGQLLYDAHLLPQPNAIQWLSDPKIALVSVSIPDVWLTTSFITLVLFAGLQNIPGDVLEAARLDGARYPTLLFRIVIPLLRPVIAVALIVRGVDAARAFDVIVLQTNGGPQNATETMSLLVYQTQIRYGDPGLASAMGTIYLIAMLAVAIFAIFKIWRPGSEQ
ncbi:MULTISPECIES: carbohydrate ABC transporter permease [unclassified Curtobacterium]|uniref:carbohydrate ABC transporter permease n=1 Tax=unclassified Curtobacterium TaxID=257496 RepID=UPI000DA81583|nr:MULTISPECIES: sugar ABC transporter permease [unclassified Curtobacterium]PZE27135.1 sugar ABC transporter permease [Curtobacterium sp. MCBD17_028]PZF60344.1 sugar ABC transporter permease [Curtobacterium sp. MCBD17_034]PZM35029.1 sugar ABC transporter permease [Curtobacterium sp. MCBD17_031]